MKKTSNKATENAAKNVKNSKNCGGKCSTKNAKDCG